MLAQSEFLSYSQQMKMILMYSAFYARNAVARRTRGTNYKKNLYAEQDCQHNPPSAKKHRQEQGRKNKAAAAEQKRIWQSAQVASTVFASSTCGCTIRGVAFAKAKLEFF